MSELIKLSQPALSKVHPELKVRVESLIESLSSLGYYFGAFMGLRTWDEQAALYAQGRSTLGTVNMLRQKAGYLPIAEWQNKRVTNAPAGKSFHNYGLAVDLVEDGDPTKAGIQWSWASTKSYMKIGPLAKDLGLDWGGLWKSLRDWPHVELTAGMTLDEARTGYLRGGIPYVWESLDIRLGKMNG